MSPQKVCAVVVSRRERKRRGPHMFIIVILDIKTSRQIVALTVYLFHTLFEYPMQQQLASPQHPRRFYRYTLANHDQKHHKQVGQIKQHSSGQFSEWSRSHSVNNAQRNQSRSKAESSQLMNSKGSKMMGSKSGQKSCRQHQPMQSIENQEEESFSRILIREINGPQPNSASISKVSQQMGGLQQSGLMKEMVLTLRQIKEITKDNLAMKKKLIKLMEENGQTSFLGQDRLYKPQLKSKGSQEKSSNKKTTIKGQFIEERISKAEEMIRTISKRMQQDCPTKCKPSTLKCTKKKSLSFLR